MKTVSLPDFYPASTNPLHLSDSQAREIVEALIQQLEKHPEHHIMLDCQKIPDLTVSVSLILLPPLLQWNQQHPNKLVFANVSPALQMTLNATLGYAKAQGLLPDSATALLLWDQETFALLGPLSPALEKTWACLKTEVQSAETIATQRSLSVSTARRHLHRLKQYGLIQQQKQGKSFLYHHWPLQEPAIPFPTPAAPSLQTAFDPEEYSLHEFEHAHLAMLPGYSLFPSVPRDLSA